TYAALLGDARVVSLVAADAPSDEELIASATKALRGDVLGLAKYMPWGVTTFSMTLESYDDKNRAIELLLEYASVAGCRGAVRDRVQLAADEMIMNALYHGGRAGTAAAAAGSAAAPPTRSPRELAQLPVVGAVPGQYRRSGR